MKTTFKKDGKVSLEMTVAQYWMVQRCFELISEHLDYDEDFGEYEVQANDIVATFDKDEMDTINSITF